MDVTWYARFQHDFSCLKHPVTLICSLIFWNIFFFTFCDAYQNLAKLLFYLSHSYFIYTATWMSTPYIFTPALFQGPIYQRYVNFKSLDQILSKRTCRSMYYVICMYVQWFYPKGSRELQRSFAVDSSTPSGGLV